MRRIFLFLLTNIAVLVVLSVTANILGADRWLSANGLNYQSLWLYAIVFGMGGAFISLLLSKPIAKWSTGAWMITGKEGEVEAWLVARVAALAERAGIATPEVAIYPGAPNAFATGPTQNKAMVAVSTGLLSTMDAEQLEAVLAHEIAHVAAGDMVTLALLQGVLNVFVVAFSRIVGFVADKAVFKRDGDGPGVGYFMTTIVFDILFGALASLVVAAFSRRREYRADSGAALLLGSTQPMIHALQGLAGQPVAGLPKGMQAFGIAGAASWYSLFASHPSLEKRIQALRQKSQS